MVIKDALVTEKMVTFWNSIFSNFYPCNFVHKGLWFKSSEQAFMWEKAVHFKDTEMCIKILKSVTPKLAKELGRSVKGFNAEAWSDVSYGIMVEVLQSKFEQNKGLKAGLLSTGNRTLVEGSPKDSLWGVGIHWQDVDCLDPSKWKGQNLLGKALMEVREALSNNG